MNSRKALIALSAIALLMSACSKEDKDDKKKTLVIPTSINEKVDVGTELTLQQKLQLKTYFKGMSTLKISGALFVPADETVDQSRRRQSRLQNATLEQKEFLADLGRCQIKHPNRGDAKFGQDMKTGSKASAEVTSSLSGADCPVEENNTRRTNFEITNLDRDAQTMTIAVGSESSEVSRVKAQKWSDKTGAKAMSIGMKADAVIEQIKGDKRTYLVGQINGTTDRLPGAANLSGNVEGLESENRYRERQSTLVFRLKIALKDLPADLSIVKKRPLNGAQTSQAYLNGHAISAQELSELFDGTFDEMLENADFQ